MQYQSPVPDPLRRITFCPANQGSYADPKVFPQRALSSQTWYLNINKWNVLGVENRSDIISKKRWHVIADQQKPGIARLVSAYLPGIRVIGNNFPDRIQYLCVTDSMKSYPASIGFFQFCFQFGCKPYLVDPNYSLTGINPGSRQFLWVNALRSLLLYSVARYS